MALRTHFFTRPWPFELDLGFRTDFAGQNGMIFEVCRRSCTFGANCVRAQQNTVKTIMLGYIGTFARQEKSNQNSIPKRVRSRSMHHGRSDGSTGASAGRPGDAFGCFLAALGLPGASQDRPRGGIWPSISRPKRVWTRPQNGLERPKRPKIDVSSIFG